MATALPGQRRSELDLTRALQRPPFSSSVPSLRKNGFNQQLFSAIRTCSWAMGWAIKDKAHHFGVDVGAWGDWEEVKRSCSGDIGTGWQNF